MDLPALPIELIKSGSRIPVLRCYATASNGQKIPYDMLFETGPYVNPFASRIVELMEICHVIVKQSAGLEKKIESLISEKTLLEGQVKKLEYQLNEMKGRIAKKS